MKFKFCILLFIGVFFFSACDLLRFSKFEVISWTPGGGYHHDPEKIIISLSFSRDPDRLSVERNFSLTGDGSRIRGNFSWEGRKMIFSPFSNLAENTDYIINLTADARDTGGLSMDDVFNCDFTTRMGKERPALVSFFPAMYQEIDDPGINIILAFSLPVQLKTLYENVSFSPSMTGLWSLDNEGKTAVFTPSEQWIQNNRYEMNISFSLTDNKGTETGNDFKSVFTIGIDHEVPRLLSARRITKNGDVYELTAGFVYNGAEYSLIENPDWEKDDKISLIFSKPVDSGSVKNLTSIDDGPNLIMETTSGFHTEIIFRFENPAAYESRLTLKIKQGIKDSAENESDEEYNYKIFANGKFSKPPELKGLRMPLAPGNKNDHQLKFFGIDSLFNIINITDENYPSGESISTWIELYFSAAEDAFIDLFSVMGLFRIETSNNVITFSPRRVKSDNFTIPEPQDGYENLRRVEISGNLVNSTYFGIINFIVTAGLKDTYGNINENSFRISLIK